MNPRGIIPAPALARARRWLLLLISLAPTGVKGQITRFERDRALIMLDVVRDDVTKHYFDSTYGGLDVKAVFDSARVRIGRAERLDQAFGAIAVATMAFEDSHTAFVPPGLVYRAEYGWDMRFVGDTCRIIAVKQRSDAASKGLRVGDAVLAVNGIPLTRRNLWQLKYTIHALQPRSSLRIRVRSPGANSVDRDLEIMSTVIQRRRLIDPNSSIDLWELIREGENEWEERAPRYVVIDDRVVVWRLTAFHAGREWVDDLAKALRGKQALVLDLRGNPGGAVTSLLRLVGHLHEQNVAVATEVGRKGLSEMVAVGGGKHRFEGQLVVIVDAESGSASEVLARSAQLTGRGKVVGDRTAGAVRKSMTYVHAVGTQTAAFYGTSVTVSDVMMPDGGLLENSGVMPDEVILPSGQDLAVGDDPVLARALALAGVTRTSKEAGSLIPRK